MRVRPALSGLHGYSWSADIILGFRHLELRKREKSKNNPSSLPVPLKTIQVLHYNIRKLSFSLSGELNLVSYDILQGVSLFRLLEEEDGLLAESPERECAKGRRHPRHRRQALVAPRALSRQGDVAARGGQRFLAV